MYFDIYWADLNPTIGREQAGHRPVLVISNDIENQMDIVTIIPLTTRKPGRYIYPNEVSVTLGDREAILLCHQIRTISKRRLNKKIGKLHESRRSEVIGVLCRRFEG